MSVQILEILIREGEWFLAAEYLLGGNIGERTIMFVVV